MEEPRTKPSDPTAFRLLRTQRSIEHVLTVAKSYLEEHMNDGRKARQDATVLLAHVLQISYEQVRNQKETELTKEQLEPFIECITRRAQDEPIDYIRGYCHFMSRRFVVDHSVMTPTPVTAQLVEKALSIIQSESQELIIGDVGTGCGAIALSIALEVSAPLIAMDVSKDAVAIAEKNGTRLGVGEHLAFRCCDLISSMVDEFTQKPHNYSHVILCANLPYHAENDWDVLEPSLANYEPEVARRGGADGLDLYRRLFGMIAEHRDVMPQMISVVLEVAPNQSQILKEFILGIFVDAKIICSPGRYDIVDIIVCSIRNQRGQTSQER